MFAVWAIDACEARIDPPVVRLFRKIAPQFKPLTFDFIEQAAEKAQRYSATVHELWSTLFLRRIRIETRRQSDAAPAQCVDQVLDRLASFHASIVSRGRRVHPLVFCARSRPGHRHDFCPLLSALRAARRRRESLERR